MFLIACTVRITKYPRSSGENITGTLKNLVHIIIMLDLWE